MRPCAASPAAHHAEWRQVARRSCPGAHDHLRDGRHPGMSCTRLCHSSHALQHKRGDPVERMTELLGRCAPRAATRSSHPPDLARASRARRLLPFIPSAAPTTTCVCARRCGVQVSRSMLSSLCAELHGSCCALLAGPTVRSVSASGGAQGPTPTKLTARPRWHPRAGTQTGVRPSGLAEHSRSSKLS